MMSCMMNELTSAVNHSLCERYDLTLCKLVHLAALVVISMCEHDTVRTLQDASALLDEKFIIIINS